MHTTHHIDPQFKIIADATPVFIWLSDPTGACVFLNKEWLSFTGQSLEENMENALKNSVFPADVANLVQSLGQRKIFELEFRIRRHDGIYQRFICKGVPRFGSDEAFNGFSGSCIAIQETPDIDELLEQKIAERTQQLRNQKAFSDKIINSTVDIMIVFDENMNFLSLNDAARKLYQIGSESIGKNLFDVFPEARDSQGHLDALKALSGETVHNHVYRSAIVDAWFEDHLIPLYDDKGHCYGALLVARDITDRIKAEEELKSINDNLVNRNNELRSSNEDLASFNYVASHDLQEPLRKVNIFASRILENEKDKLSEQSLVYFDRINSAITRMQNLIMALLEYSRTESEEVRRVKTNLNKTVKEALSGLDEVIKSKKAVIEVLELPSVSVIPLQMQQLFQNLISNSLKYSKPDVSPEIKISAVEVEVPERDNQIFWKISVADNGIGFDMEYKQKIFELFQRLHGKTEIEGTGVGLAICRKIANNHNGFITTESQVGVGSSFSVYLPAKK